MTSNAISFERAHGLQDTAEDHVPATPSGASQTTGAFSVTGAAPRLPAVAAENTGLLKPHHPAALWQVLLRTPRNCVPKDTVPFEVPHCLRSR